MFQHERLEVGVAAADQGRRAALREEQGGQLLVVVAQALRVVHHQRTGLLGHAQHLGVVDEFGIHRRILAHQHHLAGAEGGLAEFAQREPVMLVVAHLQRRGTGHRHPVAQRQPTGTDVMQGVATALGFQQHGEGGVLGDLDVGDGIHHHDDVQRHGRNLAGRR